jgi:hypothetical protein
MPAMILAVTEKYHDYEPAQYFLDTDKLDPENYVDRRILEEGVRQSNSDKFVVSLDVTKWETDPAFGGAEPHVSEASKRDQGPAEKMLLLTLYFD